MKWSLEFGLDFVYWATVGFIAYQINQCMGNRFPLLWNCSNLIPALVFQVRPQIMDPGGFIWSFKDPKSYLIPKGTWMVVSNLFSVYPTTVESFHSKSQLLSLITNVVIQHLEPWTSVTFDVLSCQQYRIVRGLPNSLEFSLWASQIPVKHSDPPSY